MQQEQPTDVDVLAGTDWRKRYAAAALEMSAARATDASEDTVFLCGMSACVDAIVNIHDAQALLGADDPQAAALTRLVLDRAARGIGGEVRFTWPEGPAWLREHVDFHYAIGGTGPQAAWVLSRLGRNALMALEDRHELMLRQCPPSVLLAQLDGIQHAGEVRPSGPHIPEIFIFEFTAGVLVGGVLPPRSSRVIVRFCDRGIQHDQAFEQLSLRLAPSAAAGLLSGLNDEASENVPAAAKHVFELGRAWSRAGLQVIHLELAGYASQPALRAMLQQARGAITSLGLSHSELLALEPSSGDLAETLTALAERLHLNRLCVHADTWAASVTLADPETERRALMAGCAAAAARAANGKPVTQVEIAPEARFHALPFEESRRLGRWSFIACPSPYLERPATTLGLGDTFTAGCLLVLGERSRGTADLT